MGKKDEFVDFLKDKFDNITEIYDYDDGGQKLVYEGKHKDFGKIALKIIFIENKNQLDRAIRELDIASKFNSKYFPEVKRYGSINFKGKRALYIIEEFISGSNLNEILDKKEQLDLDETLFIGKELLKALSLLHNENLVHRDVKPKNIIINKNRIVLIDFGIIRDLDAESLTNDLQPYGPMTYGYAAPEQIKNKKSIICNRTDLFAWGIVMYECINGYNPFLKNSSSGDEIISKSCNYDPERLECENQLFASMIHKCLEKSLHRRPKSCEYLLNIL